MSLGVLNNISAIYAENNLNNTNNSLSNVLQQLSSGSKINSGADDAAGLSLINGLQANSQALAQSQTNASEGVGLLKVADGALSQVTNLLNRAVTLATEVSNGTLNSSQQLSANQEYQSILSEINNIGATTTYNQQQVFNSNTSIYTGDSSNLGASINSLNIRSLSSSNVGDTDGLMSYSNGTNNVFIDLSKGGQNAAVTDSLGSGPSSTTTIAVNYMTKGAGGSAVSATANISVGAGTNYANTAQGLIQAINGSGLGLTATFGTAAQAGSAAATAAQAAITSGGASTDTGIIISGAGVGTGTNGAGEVGTLTVAGSSDLLAGTLTVTGSDGASHNITLGTANSTDNLANLASTINGGGYGITATVNTATLDGHAIGTVLTFSSANATATVTGANVTDTATSTASAVLTAGSALTATTTYNNATLATLAVNSSLTTLGSSTATATTLALHGVDGVAWNIVLGTAGSTDTVADLANYINTHATAASGITASLSPDGKTLTILGTGTTVGAVATTAAATGGTLAGFNNATAASLTGTPTTTGAQFTSTIGTLTTSVLSSTTNVLGGTLNIGSNSIRLGTTGTTDTMANLLSTINTGNYGVKATLNTAGTVMTLTSSNSAETYSLTGGTEANGALTANTAVADHTQIGTVTLSGTNAANTDVLTSGDSFVIAGTTISIGNGTTKLSDLAATINADNLGVLATMNTAGTTMVLTSTTAATQGIGFQSNLHDATHTGITTVLDTPSTDSSAYYSVGISGSVTDSTTQGGTLNVGMISSNDGKSGIATISYSDAAGQSLSATDLNSTSDAQTALNALNLAIADVAAQDGYIGAQINTLNAVSSVLSTQQQNVTAAQNAVQATDYASATSAMSKYEILSQTGIAALAQANSVQQEVTKLLQ